MMVNLIARRDQYIHQGFAVVLSSSSLSFPYCHLVVYRVYELTKVMYGNNKSKLIQLYKVETDIYTH
jgi:hypothetical protein